MEFNILKGKNLAKFEGSSYVGALFFDLSSNTIYFGADKGDGTVAPIAMDQTTIQRQHELSIDTGRYVDSFAFKSSADDTIVKIEEARIPSLDDTTWDGKDAKSEYYELGTGKAGLMNSVDKLVLDKIAEALGIETEYYMKSVDVDGATLETHEIRFKMDLSSLASQISEASNKFDGGTAADDLALLTAHGNLKKGTTIADLENMSYSEILKAILFETAEPTKILDCSTSLSFKSPFNTTVDVGRDYPTAAELSSSFVSETWQWTSANDENVKGDEVALSIKGEPTYYYSTTNSNASGTVIGDTADYTTTKVKAGTNGYFFVEMSYTAGDDAVDSLGNTADSTGTLYAAAKEGTIKSSVKSFVGAWHVYSNAGVSVVSSKSADAAKWEDVTPSSSKDIVAADTNMKTAAGITDHGFATSSTLNFYAGWTAQTTAGYNPADKYVMYVPSAKSIKSIKAYNGATGKWDITIDIPTPETLSLSNSYTTGDFKVYTFNNNGSLLNYYFTIS